MKEVRLTTKVKEQQEIQTYKTAKWKEKEPDGQPKKETVKILKKWKRNINREKI